MPVVSEFVSELIGEQFRPPDPNLGMLTDGKLIAGCVFNFYTGSGICMNVAASEKGWLNRAFLRAAFGYPFRQLNCRRVTGLVRTDNVDAQRFDEALGFKREGLLRQADDDGCDLIVYGMLKSECRWLNI